MPLAVLISAAPELYDAAVSARTVLADELATRERSALPTPDEDEEASIAECREALELLESAIAKAEGRAA